MPLDPTVSALFERFPDLLTYQVWEKTPEEARETYRKLCNASDAKDLAIGKSERLKCRARPVRLCFVPTRRLRQADRRFPRSSISTAAVS